MAITRRWIAGAEVDTTGSRTLEFTSYDTDFLVSAFPKSGNYSYRCGGGSFEWGIKAIPATRQIRLGFHVYVNNVATSPLAELCSILAAASAELVLINCSGPALPGLFLRVGGSEKDRDNALFAPSAWYHIGLDVKIDSSAGWVKLYVDGTEKLTFAGNTGNSDIEAIRIGTNDAGYGTDWYFDDIYVDDLAGEGAAAVVPDLRFEFLTPDGNGNYADWDGSDGNQVDNFEQVDEQPHDSDTTYNEAQAADEQDSYTLTTHAVTAGWQINAVIPTAVAKKTNAGVGTLLQMFLRVGSDDDLGDAGEQALGTSYSLVWDRHIVAPDAGAWTQADLDALEVGIEGEGAFS